MIESDTQNQEVDGQIDDRDRRALKQYLTVLEDVDDDAVAVTASGRAVAMDGSRSLEDQVREADREEALEILGDYDPFIADGGVTVCEAAGDCEVTTTDDVWKGPFIETNRYGEPIGAKYFRCRDCDREVLEGINKEHVSHRDGCRFEGH